MFAWLSEGFPANQGMPATPVKATIDTPITHSSLPHTLLGLLGVKTGLYVEGLDVLSGYRASAGSAVVPATTVAQ
jgi:hypothetical protein